MKYLSTILTTLLAVASWSVYATDDPDHLTCYEIRGGEADAKVKIFDQFFSRGGKIKVGDSALLCDFAVKKVTEVYT